MPRMSSMHMRSRKKALERGEGGGPIDLDEGLDSVKRESEAEHNKKMCDIIVYIVFMVLFTSSTLRGLQDSNYYYFGRNLANQLVGVEMPQWHSPQFDKTFNDVATVEELYHWMLGPLIHTVYSPSTFDGDGGWDWTHSNNDSARVAELSEKTGNPNYLSASEENPKDGWILGYGKLLGSVRISQLRSNAYDCNDRVHRKLKSNFSWTCYGHKGGFFSMASTGDFTTATEFKSDFGEWSRFQQSQVVDDEGSWAGEVEVGTYTRMRSGSHDGTGESYQQPLPLLNTSNRAPDAPAIGLWPQQAYEQGALQQAKDEAAAALAAGNSSGRRLNPTQLTAIRHSKAGRSSNETLLFPSAPYGTQQFRYDGLAVEPAAAEDGDGDSDSSNGYSVSAYAHEGVGAFRNKALSSFRTQSRNMYPAPAYAVYLPPGLGKAAATAAITDLMHSGYVDLHTRAVFVDLSVYNPMLDRIAHIRLVGEMTKAGGVMPMHELYVVRLWERVTKVDDAFLLIKIVVAAFYFYYTLAVFYGMKKKGIRRFLGDFLNLVQVLNICFFVASQSLRIYATTLFPVADVQINSGIYLDMLPIAKIKEVAIAVTGVNVFLNWFKAIAILSYSPTFAVINHTLKSAAPNVASFAWVFFIVFYGFTQTHAMIFHSKLEGFKDLPESAFSLLRALLGDFDFLQMQKAERWIGPILFILFIANMFFVVLNMLIAIISDAYELSRNQLKDMQQVDLLASIKRFLVQSLRKKWCFGCCVRCCCRATYRRIRAEEERAKRTELAAVDAASGGVGMMEEIDRSMEAAMEKMKTSNPSDLILVEWFDSLKQQEEELGYFHQEMEGMKKDVDDLKHALDTGLKSIDTVNTGLTQSLMLLGTNLDQIAGVSGGSSRAGGEAGAEAIDGKATDPAGSGSSSGSSSSNSSGSGSSGDGGSKVGAEEETPQGSEKSSK